MEKAPHQESTDYSEDKRLEEMRGRGFDHEKYVAEIRRLMDEKLKQPEWHEMELHLREWILGAANDKEKMQEAFDALDLMIENGIYLRQNGVDFDVRPIGNESGGFGSEARMEYDFEKMLERMREISNARRSKARDAFNDWSVDMDAIERDHPNLINTDYRTKIFQPFFSGVRLDRYIPGYILGTAKVQHFNDELSWGYRSSPERLEKFAKFAEGFKRTPEEKEEILKMLDEAAQRIKEIESRLTVLNEEITKASKEKSELEGQIKRFK